jgi:hypothetical protein
VGRRVSFCDQLAKGVCSLDLVLVFAFWT